MHALFGNQSAEIFNEQWVTLNPHFMEGELVKRTLAFLTICVLCIVISGCGGGGGGGSSSSSSTTGSISGSVSLTGSNATSFSEGQSSLMAPPPALKSNVGELAYGSAPLVPKDSTGFVRVAFYDLGGNRLFHLYTDEIGRFIASGLPKGEPMMVVVEKDGLNLVHFVTIPNNSSGLTQVQIDPLTSLVAAKIRKMYLDRGIDFNDAISVNPAAIARQVQLALYGIREAFDVELQIEFDELHMAINNNADLFDSKVPKSLLDAVGNSMAAAAATIDLQNAAPEEMTLAVAKKLYYLNFALLLAMDGNTDAALLTWVLNLPSAAKLSGIDFQSPYSGSGPCLVFNPFVEPDRNDPDWSDIGGIDGPVFRDSDLAVMANAMATGKRYTLDDLHKIFFRSAGAGFMMTEGGHFGDIYGAFVLTGTNSAEMVPFDGDEPDFSQANPIEPPFDYTFDELIGEVPNLEELRQDLFHRRTHLDWNPTGCSHDYVVCKDDQYWQTSGKTINPVKVNISITRDGEGGITAGTVTEAADGQYYLGFTHATEGDEGRFRFINITTGRELRTEKGMQVCGVRSGYVDLSAGKLDTNAIYEAYKHTGSYVYGGPCVEINGNQWGVVYASRSGSEPYQVKGPVQQASGDWDLSAAYATADGNGRQFYLGFCQHTFPYDVNSKVTLIDAASGDMLFDSEGAPIYVSLSEIETEASVTLHDTYTRVFGGEVPNPRYNAAFDPYYDDFNNNGRFDQGEMTFSWRPFVSVDIENNWDLAFGQPGYLCQDAAYHCDPKLYSLTNGDPFSWNDLPPGFDWDRSPKDNGLRLRKSKPRDNGFFYRRPHTLFNLLLAAFPPEFFDGNQFITQFTQFDAIQALAIVMYRFETPVVLEDIALDLDSSGGTNIKQMPSLEFHFSPQSQDINDIMTRVMNGFNNVPD